MTVSPQLKLADEETVRIYKLLIGAIKGRGFDVESVKEAALNLLVGCLLQQFQDNVNAAHDELDKLLPMIKAAITSNILRLKPLTSSERDAFDRL